MEEILAVLIINLLCTLRARLQKIKKKKKTALYGRIGTTIDSRPG